MSHHYCLALSRLFLPIIDSFQDAETSRLRQMVSRVAVVHGFCDWNVVWCPFSRPPLSLHSSTANIGGEASGAMSWSFREAFAKNGFDQTYTQLLGNIRTLLNGKYTQVPQMSTGHRMMDLKTTKFIM